MKKEAMGPIGTKPYLNFEPIHRESIRQLTKVQFITNTFLTDGGDPFLFTKRPYLYPIYNRDHRYLVLLASRQAEKSSLLAKDMLTNGVLNNNDSLLYITSQQRQVSEFVHRKIDTQFRMNQELMRDYLGPGSTNNVWEKILKNGTSMSFRAAGSGAESIRGIVARKIYFDETQAILSDSIPVILECAQSYPDSSAFIFTGTPLSSRNILSRKYYETCQNEWLITCSHCGYTNPPLGLEHIDETKPFLFCTDCGKKMNPTQGEWIPMNPDSTLTGYRISRLMTPTCRWRSSANDGILDKVKDYPEAQFVQEVLGLPYDRSSLPITEEEILLCCEDYDFIDVENPPDWIKGQNIFAAIDWAWNSYEGGQSFTILALGLMFGNRIKIIFARRYQGAFFHNPDNVLTDLVTIFQRLNVKIVATDFGVGHKENLRLRGHLNSKVYEMMYVSSNKPMYYDPDSRCYKLDRTSTLDFVFQRLKKKIYLFPKAEVIRSYSSDILNVYTEYDPNYKRLRYEHAGTGPDDFLHLLNYIGVSVETYYNHFVR